MSSLSNTETGIIPSTGMRPDNGVMIMEVN